jgi:hypothetical protein
LLIDMHVCLSARSNRNISHFNINLEPLKNQTLKNARLPNRIINDIRLVERIDTGKESSIRA